MIKEPFTVEFDIKRNILTSANTATIRVFNLKESTRNKIRKDQYDYGTIKRVQLRAGYGSSLSIIFDGNIFQAWSTREGTEYITQIESYDGGFAYANSDYSNQFPANTSNRDVISDIVGSLSPFGVSKGAIGQIAGNIPRGNSFSGNGPELLTELSNQSFFIDNGKANVLGESEVIDTPVKIINSASGLISTPIRETTYINFDMIFEPQLLIGQRIDLQSITEKNFNGIYKVVSLHHKGVISEAVGGPAITSVGLFYGPESLTVVPEA